jgi:hypothetical protein
VAFIKTFSEANSMAVRVLAAAALSALLMFVWGFVFWGPVLNMTARLMTPLPTEVELDLLAPMRAAKLSDGMYVYPGPLADMSNEEAKDAWTKKIEIGPILHMAYHSEGVSPTEPMMYVKGLMHVFVIALLAAMLMVMVVHTLPSYASRVGFLFVVSLIAAIWTNVGNVIWWGHTPGYAAGQIAYDLGAGLLMALATAAIVRTPSPVAVAQV